MPMTPNDETTAWLTAFEGALAGCDWEAASALFLEDSYWRDLTAFTWNIKTMEGRDAICAMLAARGKETSATTWRLDGDAKTDASGVTEAWLTFETAAGRGQGILRLRDGKAWVLFTALRELKGFEEARDVRRPFGVEYGAVKDRVTWLAARQREQAELGYTTQPYVLIVGGGQGGIGLGARLKQLNVPAIIIERNARAGDSWRNRYDSLTLHDTVWFDHLPYIPFPSHWPVYTAKDKMGDWLEAYTSLMELNYWTSTTCKHASYDEAAARWTVEVERDGVPLTLNPTHLVLATGMSGMPKLPSFPGIEEFEGDLYHSSRYRSGEAYRGKHAIVLGSNNSAHDICQDLWEYGAASITMVQRSSSTVVRRPRIPGGVGPYSESAVAAGLTTDRADLLAASVPHRLAPIVAAEATRKLRADDADYYARLEAAGFLLDFGEDDTGVAMKYQRRGSGYYIDVGCTELIVSGEIMLRTRVTIDRLKPRSVLLSDGSELPADLVACATGYGSMNGWAAQLISQEVADRVGKVWGLGSDTAYDPGPWEGEQRNMWRPTQQPGLWFHGGNLAQSRHYSLYLALQLKARLEGIPTPVYELQPSYHLS
jgi:putative flavoprotein involved in K+ transport